MPMLMLYIAILFPVFIAALLVAAFVCDRLGIGTNQVQPQSAPLMPQPPYMLEENYKKFLSLVMLPCVRDNYSACGLHKPGGPAKHMVPDSKGYRSYNGRYWFCYDFDRDSELVNGIHQGMQNRYTTLPVKDMAQMINASLGNYSIQAGCGDAKIVDQKDLAYGRVRFVIACEG